MTREEIMRLEGRELDAAVVERVMGWESIRWVNGIPVGEQPDIPFEHEYVVPEYSTDIAEAWRVIERIWDLGWYVDMGHYEDEWEVAFYNGLQRYEDCGWPPAAVICRAALLAVCGEENSDADA